MTVATLPSTSSLRRPSSRRNLSDGEIDVVPPVRPAPTIKSSPLTARSLDHPPASLEIKTRNRVEPTSSPPRLDQRERERERQWQGQGQGQSPKLDARRRQDGFDVPPRTTQVGGRSSSSTSRDRRRRPSTRETRRDDTDVVVVVRRDGSPADAPTPTPKCAFPPVEPLASIETTTAAAATATPPVDVDRAETMSEDDERGRKRRVVPLKNSNSKVNTPKLAAATAPGLEIKTGALTPRLKLSNLPSPVNKVVTPPPLSAGQQQPVDAAAATTSPPGNVPTSPGQTGGGVVIGPPVLGLSLAYAHAGSPTERNHDAQLSHLLQMGVNLDAATATAAINVHDPPHSPPDGLIAEIAQALPQALERSDRGEITPCRGRSPAAQIAGLRDEYKQSLANSHRNRMNLLKSDGRITSARVASPRGSHIDLSWLARSPDSRLSLLSVAGTSIGTGTNGRTSVEDGGQEQQTPKNIGISHSVDSGNKSIATASSTNIADQLATALASPLAQPRFADGMQNSLGRRKGRGFTVSGPAVAKHVVDEVHQRRGSLRVVRDERKRLCGGGGGGDVSLHSGRRSVSLSSANKSGRPKPLAVKHHPSKTIASLARQSTTARAATQDVCDLLDDSQFLEPIIGRPRMAPSSRTRSASIVLKQIQDNDLAKLQRIWSAPIDEQNLGENPPRSSSSVRSSFDDRAGNEGKRGSLVNWAKLGLGWAARSPKVLADKLLNNHSSEPATAPIPNTPDLSGVKSRTSSGASSGLATPSLFDSRGKPITPDHRIHWEFLNKRRVSGSGKSRGTHNGDSPTPPRCSDSPATRPKTGLDSPQGTPARLFEVTDFDLADDYFAVPLVAQTERRPSNQLLPRSPSYGSRELPLARVPPLMSRSKTDVTPSRPSHKVVRTASGNASTVRRSPGDSSPNTPHTRLKTTPPPPMSFSAHMAVAISGAQSRSVSGKAVSSPGSTSASLSTSFDSRQAYETAKGKAGYVSFDQVMGIRQESGGK